MRAIEVIDDREAWRIEPVDIAIHYTARNTLKANVLMRESKSASLVERHHIKDAIHSDGRPWCQATP